VDEIFADICKEPLIDEKKLDLAKRLEVYKTFVGLASRLGVDENFACIC